MIKCESAIEDWKMTMEESDEEMCSDDWNKVIMKYDSET
jgi:hypothetical protein